MIDTGLYRIERSAASECGGCRADIAELHADMIRGLADFQRKMLDSQNRAMRWMLMASVVNIYLVVGIMLAFFLS